MAKVRQNIVVQGLSGSLGDQLTIRQDKAGRTIISAKRTLNPNQVFSDAQKLHQQAFREAVPRVLDRGTVTGSSAVSDGEEDEK